MAPVNGGKPAVPGTVLIYSHSWIGGQMDGVAIRMMAHAKAAIPGVEHVLLQSARTPIYEKNLCMRLSVSNIWAMLSLIHRVKPDIVHGTQEASLQVLATSCAVMDTPLVISMHTDVAQIAERDDGFSALFGKSTLGRMLTATVVFFLSWGYRNWGMSGALLFCVSEHAQSMVRRAGVKEERVAPEIWGPMVDRWTFRIDLPEDEVKAAREKMTFGIPDAYLLVYVGRVTAEKDIQFLVDALARAPKRVVLALVGPGSMCAELSKLHGPEHRLYCTGECVSREGVAIAFRAADCHVSASTMETIGLTAMEALSCGTPMLAANAQGFAEHLQHGVNARHFVPHDEASFDKELVEMMATERKGNWSPEALRASMEIASVDACTDRCLQAYGRVHKMNHRLIRTCLAVFVLYLNWIFNFFL